MAPSLMDGFCHFKATGAERADPMPAATSLTAGGDAFLFSRAGNWGHPPAGPLAGAVGVRPLARATPRVGAGRERGQARLRQPEMVQRHGPGLRVGLKI